MNCSILFLKKFLHSFLHAFYAARTKKSRFFGIFFLMEQVTGIEPA